MSELVDFYQQQAQAFRSDISWLAKIQEKSLSTFTRLGFPTRQVEDWRYTTLDGFLQHQFAIDKPSKMKGNVKKNALVKSPVMIINGSVQPESIETVALPQGVIVKPLLKACHEDAEKIKPYLNHILPIEHGFQALNSAILHDGLFIYIPANTHLTTPIVLSHWQDKSQHAAYLRHILVIEAESSACIIEDYQGDEKATYVTNTMTEAYIGAGSSLTHYKIQQEGHFAYHMGHFAVLQEADSQLSSHMLSLGGHLSRSDISINLNAPHARCLMNGIYAPSGKQHIDHHTLVKHHAPNCTSEQNYKGILTGHSRAVFNGRVLVEKDAQHSEARQQNKNLLLSPEAEVDTKPQLEIFANDVVCAHGATVGQLDEDALFYLATRGIARKDANRYLVQAFLAENIRALENGELAEWIGRLLGLPEYE